MTKHVHVLHVPMTKHVTGIISGHVINGGRKIKCSKKRTNYQPIQIHNPTDSPTGSSLTLP